MRYMLIPGQNAEGELDELFNEAVEIICQYDRASTPLLQRRLSVGYARAARIMDQFEAAGVVSPADGLKPRDVLVESYAEYLTKTGEPPKEKKEDTFEVPGNYKVPSGLTLSRGENIPWGNEFSDVYNSKSFKDFKSDFSIPIGYDEEGKLHKDSLFNAGNFIVAGNTLSQKENFVDTVLLTYLLRYRPQELRLILHDPTHYLDLYNGIPHLLTPVVNDAGYFVSASKWAQSEMDRRLKIFAQAGVRDIGTYNKLSGYDAVTHILMITFYSPNDWETEDLISMLAGVSTRTGIHTIIVVGQTTGKSLPTGFKSTIPARVVFRLSSAGESKAIDVLGAEKLKPGEIIYKPNYGANVKLNAVFTPEENVKEVVAAIKKSVS